MIINKKPKEKNIPIQIHSLNMKWKMILSIMFCLFYIFSGIDIIPEAFIHNWISYIDDTIVLILCTVYIHCLLKGKILLNDTKINEKKDLYPYIIRNSCEQFHNSYSKESNSNSSSRYNTSSSLYFYDSSTPNEQRKNFIDESRDTSTETIQSKSCTRVDDGNFYDEKIKSDQREDNTDTIIW